MRTVLCDILGIDIPVIQAPMGGATLWRMNNLVSQVLEPTIGNYFRNSAQDSDVILPYGNPMKQTAGFKVLRGNPLLQEAAIDAINKWKFKPGKLNGKPVRVYFTLTVNFTLK